MDIKSKIRTIPDFPKKGIQFRDITTLIKDPEALAYTVDKMCEPFYGRGINKVVGIESRGFIFGALIAQKLKAGFVLLRKKGKLPAETVSEEYNLEYGKDVIEIHKDAITPGDKVLVVDDLVATAGTILAAINLVKKVGGNVSGVSYVIDLPDVGGSKKLKKYDPHFLVSFEGD